MKKNLRTAMVGICVMTSCLYARAQRGGGASRITQLLADVQQAVPKATLADDQKTKLQSDMDGIKSALQGGQQGEPVDRQKIRSLLNDVHTLVDSGAFAKDDQTALDKEFALLQQR
jgi:hypothetical protein